MGREKIFSLHFERMVNFLDPINGFINGQKGVTEDQNKCETKVEAHTFWCRHSIKFHHNSDGNGTVWLPYPQSVCRGGMETKALQTLGKHCLPLLHPSPVRS